MAEGRRARQNLPKNEDGERARREVIYRLRLSEDERHRLRLEAAAQGVTVSRLLVDSALHSRVRPGQRMAAGAVLNRLAGQLGKVGGNINQLAYWSNAHQTPAAGQDEALAEVRALVEELRAAAADLAGVLG